MKKDVIEKRIIDHLVAENKRYFRSPFLKEKTGLTIGEIRYAMKILRVKGIIGKWGGSGTWEFLLVKEKK